MARRIMRRYIFDLSPKGNRVEVSVNESRDKSFIKLAKKIPGNSMIKKGRDGQPAMRFPLDTQTARLLREAFGDRMLIGPELRRWGRETVARENYLANLVLSETSDLERLPSVLPMVAKMTDDRPFQRADIKFMAAASCINANQPGMGKTLEAIAATYEAHLEDGPQLVLAPVTALVATWKAELERLQSHPVLTGETPAERVEAINEAKKLHRRGKPFWLVLNHDMARMERDRKAAKILERGKEVFPYRPKHKWLFEIEWNTITVDEAHKTGVSNPDSLMAKGFRQFKAQRIWFMTATPMGGKPLRLWGYLNQIEPETYTSKWAWAERWLTIEDVDTGDGTAQSVGKVREDREDDFARSLQPVMVRRLRRDHMDDLPQEEFIEVSCSMTPKQEEQYRRFEADAEIRIEEERLSATGVLAEYARLKQFANAACYIEKYIKYNKATNEHEEKFAVIPTPDSGKLQFLVERLDENGIRAEDPEPGARAIVGSESRRMVDMTADWLNEQGIKALRIHGGIKGKDRTAAVRAFKADEIQVLVIATTAGGTALNLEEANSVHILDETWNPDDQEQLWGRGDRGTRTDSLLVYWYRTKDTIQEYINSVTGGKEVTNRNILDVRREILNMKGQS